MRAWSAHPGFLTDACIAGIAEAKRIAADAKKAESKRKKKEEKEAAWKRYQQVAEALADSQPESAASVDTHQQARKKAKKHKKNKLLIPLSPHSPHVYGQFLRAARTGRGANGRICRRGRIVEK